MRILEVFKRHTWLLPTVVFAILVLLGANMHPLWGDEAETALFARNILKYGVPKGWDGVNLMGINNAVVLNKNLINHTSPWAQYYLTALSFKLFGESPFTARLPFMLLSIASLPLLYYLALEILGKRTAFLTVLMLSLSVPFILFSYQARYYAVSVFAALALTYSLFNFDKKKFWPKPIFVISGIVFFYANYLAFAAFFLSTFLSYLVYLLLKKTKLLEIKRFIFLYLGLGLVIVLFTAPWYLAMKPFEGRGSISFVPIGAFLSELIVYFGLAYSPHEAIFPFSFFPIFLVIIGVYLRKKKNIALTLFPLLVSFIFLVAVSIITVIFNVDTRFTDFRYTEFIFPFFAIESAFLISTIWKWKKWVGIILSILLLFTNLLSFSFNRPRILLLEFLGEVLHPYQTPDRVVGDYLEENAKQGDTAFVNLDRDHEPLEFILKDKIKFIDRVSLTNKRIFPENKSVLPRYIWGFRQNPDWVILYSRRVNDGTFFTFDYRSLPPGINLSDYKETIIPVFFSDMSRPEINLRSFGKIEPVYQDQIFVYHLVEK